MKLFPCFLFLILLFSSLLFSIGLTEAGEQITLSPNNGHSNQIQINAALEKGDVYLSAGVYEDDDTILIPPNRALRGDQNAIVRVWSGSSQWFVGLKGVISCGNVVAHDNIISDFQIDGNIGSLPKGYANSRSDTDHDCQKLIILHGYSNQFASNITISNMKLYNSFSDGIYVLFGDHIDCSDNFISNCQHEGIYLSCLKNSVMYRNKIAGITSDAARLDNCVNCKVYDNLFFSYTGESYGAWKGGQAGLQIANTASSHGYDGSKKPQMTDRVEITNNTFADPGRQAIWLHNYNGSVYVHDNTFVDATGLETLGIPVGDISVDNPPTVEMSEKVFSSIFDILEVEISETGNVEQKQAHAVNPGWKTKGKAEAYIYLAGYRGEIKIGNETYIPKSPSECAIVLTDTRNLADRPAGQTSSLALSDGNNNTLKAELKVKTSYRVKSYQKVLGFSIPDYKTKSSNSRFTETFDAPRLFPVLNPPKAYVTYFRGSHAVVNVPNLAGIVKVEYALNNSSAREYRLIGEVGTAENGFRSTVFNKVSTWKYSGPQMSRSRQGLYISEPFNVSDLKITVTTPYDTMKVTDFEYTVIEDTSRKMFNLGLLTLIVLCLTYGRAIYKILMMITRRWV